MVIPSTLRTSVVARIVLVCGLSTNALAETAPPIPTSYTVVQQGMGQSAPSTVYRDGARAVVDLTGSHTRSYYEISVGRAFSWMTNEANPQCGTSNFSGDWGDPFNKDILADLAKMTTKNTGTEVVNGIKTKVIEATDPKNPASKMTVWIDLAYGELVKLVAPGADGKPTTLVEVKSITLGKPPASTFAMPGSCVQAANQPPPKTQAQIIAELTGTPEGTYVTVADASHSTNRCAVEFSVVEPKTLKPIEGGYHIATDTTVAAMDLEHPPHYTIGHDIDHPDGPLFSGGGLREQTDRLSHGVLKMGYAAPGFAVELSFEGGGADARVYRHCGKKPVAKLYFVLKDATKLSGGGEWVWEN